jgi:hypothetical protein
VADSVYSVALNAANKSFAITLRDANGTSCSTAPSVSPATCRASRRAGLQPSTVVSVSAFCRPGHTDAPGVELQRAARGEDDTGAGDHHGGRSVARPREDRRQPRHRGFARRRGLLAGRHAPAVTSSHEHRHQTFPASRPVRR